MLDPIIYLIDSEALHSFLWLFCFLIIKCFNGSLFLILWPSEDGLKKHLKEHHVVISYVDSQCSFCTVSDN